MSSDEPRPTVRPVTLSRLIEVTHACSNGEKDTGEIEGALGVSHRRARETILEALRMGIIGVHEVDEEEAEETYETTDDGLTFLGAIEDEDWSSADEILRGLSPHYGNFVDAVESIEPAPLEELLQELEDVDGSHRTYNQTSVEVLGDWSERLGGAQRNAFTGDYYLVDRDRGVPADFGSVLLSVYDDLEETAGVNLRQRHISIPELREHFCERVGCERDVFDAGLLALAEQNVGRVELSGAPIDTGAKDSLLAIKQIELSEEGGLVSTSQSSERVMSGVEQNGKQYYYFAVHDRDIEFSKEEIR